MQSGLILPSSSRAVCARPANSLFCIVAVVLSRSIAARTLLARFWPSIADWRRGEGPAIVDQTSSRKSTGSWTLEVDDCAAKLASSGLKPLH